MNCQSFKNQIDEAASTAELNRHLEACADCKTFREERECLSRLLAKLEHVNAPTNFEFGVRAKLNSLPATNGTRVWIRRFAFATPALAAVAISAFVFTNYNVFSPNANQPIVVQSDNVAPTANPSPVVSPTQPMLVAANTNPAIDSPVTTKEIQSAPNQSKQVAASKGLVKQSNSAARKQDKDVIGSKDSDNPINSRQEALNPAPTPLIQPEFRGKVAPSQVLSIFGIEKISDDGTVESVNSKSEAAGKGILAGDRIETINGQKFSGADLNNSFRQVKIEVLRNGTKRIVTMDLPLPK